MIAILQLIIAHLLADFVFQTNKLVKEKAKHFSGQLKHAGILAICVAFFIFPYLNTALGWLTLIVVSGTHLIQDTIKVRYENKHNKKNRKIWPFFLDQAVHLSIIVLFGYFLNLETPIALPSWLADIYFNADFSLFISLSLLFSFTIDVILFQVKRSKKRWLKYHRHYKSMSMRLLAFLTFYIILISVLRFSYGV